MFDFNEAVIRRDKGRPVRSLVTGRVWVRVSDVLKNKLLFSYVIDFLTMEERLGQWEEVEN